MRARAGRVGALAALQYSAVYQQRLCCLMDTLLVPALQAMRAASAQACTSWACASL